MPLQSGLLAAHVSDSGFVPEAKSPGSPPEGEEPCTCLPAQATPPSPLLTGRAYAFFVVEYAGELCWILSEVTWILLIPVACITTGVLAFILLGATAIRTCVNTGCRRLSHWLPPALQAYWMLTNFIWMSEELLWDAPEEATPWNLTPLVGRDDEMYEKVQAYCIASFFFAPLVWVLAVMCLAFRGCRESHRRGEGCTRRACGPAYAVLCQAGFIASWALMDAVWAAGFLSLSIASCALTIVLIFMNAAFETGLGLKGIDRTDFVWVFWTLANLLWIFDELGAGDDLNLRFIAAGVGLFALGLLMCSWRQAQVRAGIRHAPAAGAEPREAEGPESLVEAPASLGA